MNITLGSLFDGIGTFPLSGIKYGIIPIWASEIEAFPIAVTKYHFPNMKHLGDVTKINGAEIEPVDIITFGSPCQDMSVAGKREGLGGARSGLFMDAVRIIREMRRASDGHYPRFAVWENVPGAYSSNKGQDFRAVLEEIAEAEIPMPASGKWAEAGMVRTERIDVAWRTLDAQYWGVPQRRKRIFLVADFGGFSASEILFESESLRGDSAESGEAREEVARDVGDGVEESLYGLDLSKKIEGIGIQRQVAPTLTIGTHAGHCTHVLGELSRINCTRGGISGTVSSKWAKGTGGPAGDEHYNLIIEPDKQFLFENHSQDTRYVGPLEVAPIISATFGMGGNNQPFVVKDNVYSVRRLIPLECERLQGLPDNWTNIEGASDTGRYKAIGNGIAKPCSDFVIGRIAEALRRYAA